jgi:hypothetical protein
MFYLVGSLVISSLFIYKYRKDLGYSILKAFSYIEDYIPKKKQNITLESNGIYNVNTERNSLEIHSNQNTIHIPENSDNLTPNQVIISSGKIFNSLINPHIENLDDSHDYLTIQNSIAGASIQFSSYNDDNDDDNDNELDITDLFNNMLLEDHTLMLNKDNIYLLLILYNEFFDGNLLIEEYLNKTPFFTIVTQKGEIISLNAINLNIII